MMPACEPVQVHYSAIHNMCTASMDGEVFDRNRSLAVILIRAARMAHDQHRELKMSRPTLGRLHELAFMFHTGKEPDAFDRLNV